MYLDGVYFTGPILRADLTGRLAGIYAVISSYNQHVLDIGQAEDVNARLTNHERRACWIAKSGNAFCFYVHYMPGSSEQARLQLESQLRNAYSPLCGVR